METIEMAELLTLRGYKVYQEKGFNIDSIFTGLCSEAIDIDKLTFAAEKEGYTYSEIHGKWIELSMSKYLIK